MRTCRARTSAYLARTRQLACHPCMPPQLPGGMPAAHLGGWRGAGEAPAEVEAEQVEGGRGVVCESRHKKNALAALRGSGRGAAVW